MKLTLALTTAALMACAAPATSQVSVTPERETVIVVDCWDWLGCIDSISIPLTDTVFKPVLTPGDTTHWPWVLFVWIDGRALTWDLRLDERCNTLRPPDSLKKVDTLKTLSVVKVQSCLDFLWCIDSITVPLTDTVITHKGRPLKFRWPWEAIVWSYDRPRMWTPIVHDRRKTVGIGPGR